MIKAQKTIDENERLEDLMSLQVLDTDPDAEIDEFVLMATLICNVPVALVTLIDETRQWHKSRHGIDATWAPRQFSFCGHAIHHDDVFEIFDTKLDNRFHDNPLVIEYGIRFYAGAPLKTSHGHRIGTLCVIDREPRELSVEQKYALGKLAEKIMRRLELNRKFKHLSGESLRLTALNLHLEEAQELGRVGSFTHFPDAGEFAWTKQLYRTYQIPETVLNQELLKAKMSRIHPIERLGVQREMERAHAERRDYSFEHRISLPDGTIRYVDVKAQAISGPQGRGFVGVVRDITDERRLASERDAKVLELDSFFELSSDLLAIVDFKGRFRRFNPRWSQQLGYETSEIIRTNFEEFIHPDERPKMRNALTDLRGSTEPRQLETRCIAKNGTIRTLAWNLHADPLSGYVHVSATDLSDLKAFAGLLSEAQRVAKIGSWAYQAWDNRYLWSEQMYEIFDVPKNSGVPNIPELLERIHPEDRGGWRQEIRSVLHSGKPLKIKVRIQSPSGAIRWLEFLGECRRGSHGELLSVNGTCLDISSAVETEELLRQERVKAVQNSKLSSLGEMAAGIAHEINNPLAIISLSLGLIPRLAELPEKVTTKINDMDKAVSRIAKIVNGLRKFSRSSERSSRAVCQVRTLIDEALTLTMPRAHRQHVNLELLEADDVQFTCNEIEIEQVLINLLNNAIDAASGTEGRWVKIMASGSADAVTIRVIDSGHGLSSSVRTKIFQPFFTTKPVGEGTGLGLAICRGIAEEHGGSIHVVEVSDFAGHTCFELKMPLTPHQPQKGYNYAI